MLTLSTAASNGARLRLRYRSSRGEESERLLDPYGIAFHNGRWYVAGRDHLREATWTFSARPDPGHRADPGELRAPGGIRPHG